MMSWSSWLAARLSFTRFHCRRATMTFQVMPGVLGTGASGKRGWGFALQAEYHRLAAGLHLAWSADQRQFHGACLSWWFESECLHEGASLLPGQHRGGLGLALAGLGCGPGEAAVAVPGSGVLLDQLKEHSTRGTTPIASLRAHAARRLTLQRGGQHGLCAVLAQGPQHLREQRAVGFLEDLSQGVNSQGVHTFPSLTPLSMPRDAFRRPEATTYPRRPASLLGLSSYGVDTAAALMRSGVVRTV